MSRLLAAAWLGWVAVLAPACERAPPSSEQTVPDTPEAKYRAWLDAQGRSTNGAKVAPLPGDGDWTFLHVDPVPGVHQWPVAIKGDLLVAPRGDEGWKTFLTDQSVDALHRQIGWLSGMWAPMEPGHPLSERTRDTYPTAERLLTAPRRWTDGDAVLFEAWYGAPPGMVPFRVLVRATDTETTRETQPLHKLIQ